MVLKKGNNSSQLQPQQVSSCEDMQGSSCTETSGISVHRSNIPATTADSQMRTKRHPQRRRRHLHLFSQRKSNIYDNITSVILKASPFEGRIISKREACLAKSAPLSTSGGPRSHPGSADHSEKDRNRHQTRTEKGSSQDWWSD